MPEILTNKIDALPVKPDQIRNPIDNMEVDNLSNIGSLDDYITEQAIIVKEIADLEKQAGSLDQNVNNLVNPMGNSNELNPENKVQVISNQKAMEKIKELLNTKPEIFEDAQAQLNSLKKKYSYVPDSNDLMDSKRINSLGDAPFAERIIFGTNFKFNAGNPLTLDLAPLLMYKFNKVFYAGISGSYRVTINYDEKSQNNNPQDIIGISCLARHFLLKGFYAYSEMEYKSSTFSYDGHNWEKSYSRRWIRGCFIGAGKEMMLKGKLKGTIILAYDLLHSDKSFNDSNWNLKFAVTFDDLNLKNKKIN